MAFTPLDSNFASSTVLHHGPDVVATWVLLLASKNKFNETEMQATAIAGLLGISLERVDAAFEVLMSPDPRSKNKEHGGRRILRQEDGSWLIVSGEKYQDKASKAAAMLRDRKYQQNKKARAERLEPAEFVCERYGCSRSAAVVADGKRICSGHAMTDVA